MAGAPRKYDLEERLLDFAVSVIDIVEGLPDAKVCNHLGGQLLRSGTSPALNYGEAQVLPENREELIAIFTKSIMTSRARPV